jgi:polar amino acid transport system substrate-binding protein
MRATHKQIGHCSFIVLQLLLTLLNVQTAQAETLSLVVDDYPPYIDKTQDNQGFWSEMVIEAFARVGITATLQYKPWGRVERELDQANKVSFGYVKDKKRLNKWRFSHVLSEGIAGFLVKKERHFSWQQYSDLVPYRIGQTIGYSFGDEFNQWQDKLNIENVPEDLQNIQKLMAKRIDLYATEYATAAMLLREHFNQTQRDSVVFVAKPPLTIWSAHLVCAKSFDRCPYYINKFNKGLKILSREGVKQKILERIHSFN